MFSAVTHVLSEAANGAMYLAGMNSDEKKETPETLVAVATPVSTEPPVVQPTAHAIPDTPPASVAAETSTPPPAPQKVDAFVKPDAPLDVVAAPQKNVDDFDLSKWQTRK